MSLADPQKRILLHSCCGPCSTAVIHRLIPDYSMTVFFYNPNITDPAEYDLRRSEQLRFLKEFSEREGVRIGWIEGPYDPDVYYVQYTGWSKNPKEEPLPPLFELRLQGDGPFGCGKGFDCSIPRSRSVLIKMPM